MIKPNSFNLSRILSFRLELRSPPDVNREGAIFCATPVEAPGKHAFCRVLTISNLQRIPLQVLINSRVPDTFILLHAVDNQ